MKKRTMRRKDKTLPADEVLLLLKDGEYGIMATVDEAGQPYGVPLSYVVSDEKIYFHCAPIGHKIDNIRINSKVSFTVVGKVQALYDKDFTTHYESAIVFGSVSEVLDHDEKFKALYRLAEKYLPEYIDRAEGSINASFKRTAVYRISMDEISGKGKKDRKNL